MHNRSYGTLAEFNFRQQQFDRTNLELEELSTHLTTSTVGHNNFSDRTPQEMKALSGANTRTTLTEDT